MAVALPIIGVAFAAVCVWLTVRIINRREKPGVAFWATVGLVVVLLGCSLSDGPMMWIWMRLDGPEWLYVAMKYVYAPYYWALNSSPAWLQDAHLSYLLWWIR